MTYLQFHLLFNLPVILILLWLTRGRLDRVVWKWIAVLSGIVLLFTFPWDSLAVAAGIWGFDNERVALWIGYLPAEEVAFFFFETLVVALLTILFLPARKA